MNTTTHPGGIYTPAISMIEDGRPRDAIAALRAMLAFRSDDPDLYCNLALAYEAAGDVATAENGFRQIGARWPGHDASAVNLANLLGRAGRYDEAEPIYVGVGATAADPADAVAAKIGLGMIRVEQLQLAAALQLFADAARITRRPGESSLLLGYSLHGGYRRAWHQAWVDAFAANRPAPPRLNWDGTRPLRVGFVGDSFRRCATAYVLEPLLASIDPAKVQPVLFSDVREPDATTRRMVDAVGAANYYGTAGLSDLTLIELARGIDVLVDLHGHKRGNRINVFAHNAAPIQFGYIGYAGDTLLTENVDRRVGWAYRPADDAPPVSPLPAAANGFVTFGSVNRAAKLTAATMNAWAAILHRLPTARLLVAVAGGEDNAGARASLEAAGIPSDRLALAARPATHAGYLAMADRFDIHLDAFPYTGGATTCDVLYQGVPSVVLAGDDFSMAQYIMRWAMLPGYVAYDPDHYVWVAEAAADELAQLQDCRATLRARMAGLLDAAPVARAFETLAWHRAVRVTATQPASCCGGE